MGMKPFPGGPMLQLDAVSPFDWGALRTVSLQAIEYISPLEDSRTCGLRSFQLFTGTI